MSVVDVKLVVQNGVHGLQIQQAAAEGQSNGGSSSDSSPSAVEGLLLMAIEKLYKEDRELDVQMGLLRLVLQVLQRHGGLLRCLCILILVLDFEFEI